VLNNSGSGVGLDALGVVDAAEIRESIAAFVAGAPGGRVLRFSVDGFRLISPGGQREDRVEVAASALPFADGSFVRLCCIDGLRALEDPEPFLAEARRVLARGGALLVVAVEPDARTTRGLMVKAGFAWSESYEAMRIEQVSEDGDVNEIRVFATTGWTGDPTSQP
jgi:SAM-dependent methyltransferase